MKKLIYLAFILALTITFISCSSDTDAEQSSQPIQSDSTPPEAVSSDVTQPPDVNDGSSLGTIEYPFYEEVIMFPQQASINETVLVDELDVKITATSINYDGYSPEIAVVIENNSDKNLSFSSNTLGYSVNSVNGYMIASGYINTDVAAGKVANETITISTDALMLLGITELADIELGFDISDDDYNEYLITGPREIKTSVADGFDYSTVQFNNAINNGYLAETFEYNVNHISTDELLNDSGMRANSYAMITNRDGEQSLMIEFENTTDSALNVAIGNLNLNGLTVSSGIWSSETISPLKRTVVSVSVSSLVDNELLNVLNMSPVSLISFDAAIRDSDYNTMVELPDTSVAIPNVDAGYDISGNEVYNENSIRVISKGIIFDPSEPDGDAQILLLVENSSNEAVEVDVVYDSLSINDVMTDSINYSNRINSGKVGLIKVSISQYSLEDSGFASASDIENAEFTLELMNENYDTIAEPVILIESKASTVESQMVYAESPQNTTTSEDVTSESTSESNEAPVETSSTDWQQFLTDYEAWVDEYIEFMEKYKEDPEDLTLITDYAALTVELAQWSQDATGLEDELTGEDLVAYTETMARISVKLANAMI